jgi:hypothetical protein
MAAGAHGEGVVAPLATLGRGSRLLVLRLRTASEGSREQVHAQDFQDAAEHGGLFVRFCAVRIVSQKTA